MKQLKNYFNIIGQIAKAELQVLFYSPIAWLILILFTFQVSFDFISLLNGLVRNQAMGYPLHDLTSGLFYSQFGIFSAVQGSLYLYIPLLTMNLMSRELSNGSIKLLYSSPISNVQIILGKYLSMIVYALVIIAILSVFSLYGAFTIENFDYQTILSGLLGIFLLIAAYSAIGLLMSSMTSYQVVAAIGTFAILTLLNYVSGWWQDVAFVRDITYWLAIPGRSNEFVNGMICTENILYFVLIIVLFLTLAILRLQSRRVKKSTRKVVFQYVLVWVVALGIGYISSRPSMKGYYDTTLVKVNTVTPNSQKIVEKFDGDLTITTYVNLLDNHFWIGMPERLNEDKKLFERYIRFKPDTKMEYVYYYDDVDNPSFDNQFPGFTVEEKFKKMIDINGYDPKMFLTPEQIHQKIDLSGEENKFVRQLTYKDQKVFLRIFDDNQIFPTETEISAALKRLVMKLPVVGFVTGQGERATDNVGEKSYSMFAKVNNFRYSLINQGFDYAQVTLDKEIPENINIVVLADLETSLTEDEEAVLDHYIARGGNLLIAGEPKHKDLINPIFEKFGVQIMDGSLVRPTVEYSADLIVSNATVQADSLNYWFNQLSSYGYGITMPGAGALVQTQDLGYDIQPLLTCDSVGCWNELNTTNFEDEKVTCDSLLGEVEQPYTTAMALSRKVQNGTQKIILLGDADCISNGEVTRSRAGINAFNYYLITGAFYWLSDNEVPIDVRRPYSPDTDMLLTESSLRWTKALFEWIIPILLLFVAFIIWIRRRSR